MKKVLVIAYTFPPSGGAGVQRPLKFVKYLKEFGWEPAVLTVRNPSVPTADEGLIKDIPADVKIYKAKTFEPSYANKEKFASTDKNSTPYRKKIKSLISYLFMPDMQILWWPGLILYLIAIFRADRPDVVFVTAPPFSSLIPVVVFGKMFHVPVIVDFRDEWSFARSNIENAGRGKIPEFLDFWLERMVVKLCCDFTAATKSYVDSIRLRHYSAAMGKGVAITNGYDEDDFNTLKRKRNNDGKFNILYTGTVWKATSLKSFISAVENLLDEFPELIGKLSIQIFGRVVEDELDYMKSLIEQNIIVLEGYRSHSEIMQEMINADLLLLTLSDLPGANKIIPGKTFEYMATKNKILAILPKGETSALLDSYYCRCYYSNHDVKSISKNILSAISLHSEKESRCDVAKFSRFTLTDKLAKVLNGSLFDDE